MSNTIHDMGGMHGFGPVEAEPNEPVFHETWEGRVLRDAARDGLYAGCGRSTAAAPRSKRCRR